MKTLSKIFLCVAFMGLGPSIKAGPKVDFLAYDPRGGGGAAINREALYQDFDRDSFSSHGMSARDERRIPRSERLGFEDYDELDELSSQSTHMHRQILSFREIPELREHFFKNRLELSPQVVRILPDLEERYGDVLQAYAGGIYIKKWPSAQGFRTESHNLLRALTIFLNVKLLKCEVVGQDHQDDLVDCLARAVYHFQHLTELDLSGCSLPDAGIREIADSFEDPRLLHTLYVEGNTVSSSTSAWLRQTFPNLQDLRVSEARASAAAPSLLVGVQNKPAISLTAVAGWGGGAMIQVPRPIGDNIQIPEIARGFEDIYRRFVMGKLIYKPDPKSDQGRIELPIRALSNPLDGEFDLSGCWNSGEVLSINTGYRKGKKAANSNKVEIWLAPRFLIAKELTSSAKHFQPIMGDWSARAAPVGLFWTWGGWDSMGDYDYLTNESMEQVSNGNLYEKYQKSMPEGEEAEAWGSQSGRCGRARAFHVSFLN